MQTHSIGLAYRGKTASIGLARGPFVRVDAAPNGKRASGTREDEKLAFRAALDSAGRQIVLLADSADDQAAQILEFQVAFLEDEYFLDPIYAVIHAGAAADTAWSAALDEQIAIYNSAPNEYLRARSSDLADVRDRVLRILRDGVTQVPKVPDGAIVCADDLPPSRFLEIDWSNGGGVALLRGSPTSHVALLARARGVPMVVQLGAVAETAQTALLDGERATLELDPGVDQVQAFARRQQAHRKNRTAAHAILRRPAPFWEGEKIRLLINIQRVEDLEHDHAQFADGIGLMRTEFLLGKDGHMPDEEAQYLAYDAVLRWAGNRPVTIRT